MKLLVLGGTVFLGRHLVRDALDRGHEVTLFHRGRSGPELFAGEVERLLGDRDGGLDALRGRTFDAVVDTSGYVPRVVDASSALLADAVGHYTFVSSISVYADDSLENQDETAPVAKLDDPASEDVRAHYGGLKALCEEAVEAHLPGRALHVRAGLLVGPHDPTDRFTSWPRRLAAGGEVLVPDTPDAPVQLIDARDAAAFVLDAAENARAGTFNVTGPVEPSTFGAFITTCHDAAGGAADLTLVSEAFLEQQGVAPWMELPLWLPADQRGMSAVNIERAVAAGLRCRPLAETASDTLAWWKTAGREPRTGVGLPREREADLLALWAAHRS